MTDKKILAEQDYSNGMKYKDIAKKYSVNENTVKTWAKRNGWSRKKVSKSFNAPTEKNLTEKFFESVDSNEELTEKQKLFCIFYVETFNATQAYLKAYGGNYDSASVFGYRLLRNDKIQAEVKKLKEETRKYFEIGFEDYVKYLLKVVGAKISDFAEYGNRNGENFITLLNSNSVDDSAVTELKQVKGEIFIKLEDKKWAWKELAKIFGFDESEKQNAPIVIAGEEDLEN